MEKAIRDGTKNEKKQNAAETRAQRILDKWLGSADTKAVKGQYRDPVATM